MRTRRAAAVRHSHPGFARTLSDTGVSLNQHNRTTTPQHGQRTTIISSYRQISTRTHGAQQHRHARLALLSRRTLVLAEEKNGLLVHFENNDNTITLITWQTKSGIHPSTITRPHLHARWQGASAERPTAIHSLDAQSGGNNPRHGHDIHVSYAGGTR